MSLEEMSFKNLVEWNRDDLVRIMNGTLASDLFTANHRGRLIKQGVLCRVPTRRTFPTLETIRVLRVDEGEKKK